MRSFVCLLLLATLGCGIAAAQSAAPVPANGGAAALGNGETPRSNYLRWEVRTSTLFDDNALNTTSNPVRDDVSSLHTTLEWNMTRPRWNWTLQYSPGFDYSLNVPNYSLQSHSAGTEFQVRLTKRFSLQLRNSFDRSSNPFNWLRQPTAIGAPPPTEQINTSVLGVPMLRTTEQGGVDLSYALGPHSSLGIGGSYALMNYDPLNGASASEFAQDQRTASGHAFYSRQFSRRQWSGVQASYQDARAFAGAMRTQVESVVYSHTLSLTPRLAISGFAGPEHSRTAFSGALQASSARAEISSWTWSAGGSLSWTGTRTHANAGFYQQISDGAGYLGAVQLRALTAGIGRDLSRRNSVDVAVQYNVNDPLAKTPQFNSLNYFSGSVTYTRHLTDHFALDATYWYEQQHTRNRLVPLPLTTEHNRVSIGIAYEFSRPIGR